MPRRAALWNDPRLRAMLFQALVIAGVVAVGAYLVRNTLVNMQRQGIATGFGYLGREASFEIGESFIRYSPADSYGRALLVGLLNTLLVAALGVVLSTVLGMAIGIARLARNWLVRKLALVYVEALRNLPLLLQLIVWWDILRVSAPPPRQAWEPLPGVYVSVRGIVFPVPAYAPVYRDMAIAFVAAVVAGWAVLCWARRRRAATGRPFPGRAVAAILALGAPLAVFLAGGAPFAWNWPVMHAFNFSGGASLSPEFAALLFGLTAYTAAFIAEIVRSGIEGVSRGQTEAALALGLRRVQVLRLVVLPQALRIIVPPLLSEYLALTKNSSLAIAIGYPELMSITNTTLNQTGQAVEAIALMMAIYLAVSLAISAAVNWFNRRIALVER
ncbi:MAG TPA: ABC transporter permease subunit [Stellaceae bacterium]|nr:ABC transporter permease subunit [Stellaceae bacterium]